MQRKAKEAAAGGCSSYVYGASDLHIDAHNQCDHGGPHLVAITAMFTVFTAVLLLIWLHHCRWVWCEHVLGGEEGMWMKLAGLGWEMREGKPMFWGPGEWVAGEERVVRNNRMAGENKQQC